MNFEGFCVRVQAMDGYSEKMRMLRQTTDYQAIVAVKHRGASGENEHYHMVIKTQVKDQAFRVRMKKVFDMGKGNAHMSIKPWDGNIDAISYLFHEDEDAKPIVQHNVSDETITKARERNREVQVKMEEAKKRASWTIEQELLEHYKQIKRSPDIHTIAKDIVLHALRMDKYVPNDFLLKAMASKLHFKLQEGDVDREEEFAINYVSRVYRMDYDEESRWRSVAQGGYPKN
ncbi:Rep family protein [Candidatus Magnetobacterium casense]|uniref:Uncharacterized protein n=1 Tax=Candidatus Magnetobacterium casense TaxID=1455061 RepID=A0ABS6S371_9BACT|nr:Rep family protein [Candidatus Magnetobacterium casensis]MBV6343309.1 hypothetical protein [Candidatus Magnetobacterium casensis]